MHSTPVHCNQYCDVMTDIGVAIVIVIAFSQAASILALDGSDAPPLAHSIVKKNLNYCLN